MAESEKITIIAFDDSHAEDFARLNREWLDGFELYEEADGKQLYSPRQTILDRGGEILIAKKSERVVGTCALIKVSPTVFEVAKLSVARDVRGEGLGRRLIQAVIDRARARGATRVALISSSKLTTALRLYESMDFERKAIPEDQPYETADVYMELEVAAECRDTARAPDSGDLPEDPSRVSRS